MSTATDEAILLTAGSVEIEATAAPASPRVQILAYTGGLMTVPGWGPVVIDLANLARCGEQSRGVRRGGVKRLAHRRGRWQQTQVGATQWESET